MKKGISWLLAAALCLWGVLPAAPARAKPAKPADLMSGVRAAVPPSAGDMPGEAARLAVNRFSADLFRLSAKNPGNVMVSPASVYLALGMALNGAEGETKAAMLGALADAGMSLEGLNRANRGWAASLSRKGEKTDLAIANSIWFDREFRPAKAFLQRNADYYGAAAKRLDFRDPKSPGVVNGWVRESTRGTIDKIIEEIRRGDVMFLVNAVYFKSDWQSPFEKNETRRRPFHAPGRDVEADFMHRTGRMGWISGLGATGVSLPYDDGQFAFFALLPDGGLSPREWLERQEPASLFGEIAGMMARKALFTVELALPKFESRYEDQLNDELVKMGLSIAFDPDRADFSGMNESRARNLYIGEVKHKTFVRVDEKGTEASAVTSIGIRATSFVPESRKLVFDRPFVYGIMDTSGGIPLFVGIMENPAGK